jgi:D-glycero-D-manno-heptose 1,7-bisphosphate phosphatase
MKTNAAVFFDRDGTLNEDVGYLSRLDQLSIYPGSFEAVRRVNAAGMKAIVITNQSGVARGYFEEEFLTVVHRRMREILADQKAFIDGFYYCPHHPTEGTGVYRRQCDCRKPESGMLMLASEELGVDLAQSYIIGDHFSDIEAARRVSAKGILVRTGHGELEIPKAGHLADFIAEDVLEAVNWIMKGRQK